MKQRVNRTKIAFAGLTVSLSLAMALFHLPKTRADVTNLERVSLGTGGVEANNSSFFAYLSQDGRFVAFESYATNWAPDQNGNDNCFGNCVDVFVRDRLADVTTKVSVGYNGEPTNEDSLHPMITADGRYVVYTSYASNLVPNDTNSHVWFRDGLDVFLYDLQTGLTQRVSLNSAGDQIKGNSVGTASGDGRFIVFASNGRNVLLYEDNPQQISNIYLRDLQTGEIDRITTDVNTGGFPNGHVYGPQINHDGRYVVYISEATNLTADVPNGLENVFLYDRLSDQTTMVSLALNGNPLNGKSTSAQISADGRFVVFKSDATNLVPGDTNGWPDVFVYEVSTGAIQRVNISDTGDQANGLSKDPSICGDGSVVSFTSDATNLVPGDTNSQRDVFFRDLNRRRTSAATINDNNVWGDGKAHRSFLAPDCRSIAFASDATNMLPGDGNQARDLFLAQITWPPDFSDSALSYPPTVDPGDLITYTMTIHNTGTQADVVTYSSPIPASTSFVPASERGGLIYDAIQDAVQWSGTLAGESSHTVGFSVLVDATLTDFALITAYATVVDGGTSHNLRGITTVNGRTEYLPLMARQ